MNLIDEILLSYKPITLEEIDAINLMDRIDTKFIVPISVLYELLEAVSDYYVLEINGFRNSLYDTTYFDTINYDMFMDHAYDIENRLKIRVRKYLCNNLKFLEIKTKIEDGRTLKERIKVKHKGLKRKKNQEFIKKHSKYDLSILLKSLRTKFERFTLVNPEKTERITIDTSLHIINKRMQKEVFVEDMAILELKRNKKLNSRIKTFLDEYGIKSIGFSKYCFGMCLTNEFLPFMSFIDIIDKALDTGNIRVQDIESKEDETALQTLYVSTEDLGRFSLATASYDEYDTLEELKEGEKLAKALYKDTPKPVKSNDYWYYGRHNKMMSYTYPEGHYWWGYIMLDFENQSILGTGGTSLYDGKSMQTLRIKDDYFRGDDEIPEGFVWHEGEYEGWLQYRWGDGKNALDYVAPKKQKKEEDTEIGFDIETEGLDNPFDDYEAELIQTQFQDLIDKEKLEKIKERW